MATDTLSPSEQDYLKAIHHLSRRADGAPAGTVAIAAWLEVAPAAATNMVKKLAQRGLVDHSPYHGATLTEAGQQAALEILRHHRLLERFLHEQLGVPWEKIHAEADRLEHALSEEIEERIDAALGHPTTDPHGTPIPTKEGAIVEPAGQPLWTTTPGETVTVTEVEDEDPALLAYLADIGLVPGAEVMVLAKALFDGPLQVRAGVGEYALGERVARAVSVRLSASGMAVLQPPDEGEQRATDVSAEQGSQW
jgi:DtxR family transcriptional regulator, Mn-dependent transcriptional regulator